MPCVSKGQGWVCRGVGRTLPGYVLCMLHAGLGDKHLFLPAPSLALTLLTHSWSCQIPEAKPHMHTHTLPPTQVRLPKPQTSHYGHLCLEIPLMAPSIWVGATLGSTKHVCDSQPALPTPRVVTCGGKADLGVWS